MVYIFPLSIVRDALHWANAGYYDTNNYSLNPCVINSDLKGKDHIHCGKLPLSRVVYCSASHRFNMCSLAYINTDNKAVFPA